MKAVWFLVALVIAGPMSPAERWNIENNSLSVFLEKDGSLSILHKATQTNWISETSSQAAVAVSSVSASGDRRSLRAVLKIRDVIWQLDLQLSATEPELGLTLSAPADTPLKGRLDYPFALKAPGQDYRIVLPHKTGLMFTAADAASRRKVSGTYGCYTGSGLSMPWFGLTDLESGLLVLLETPMDAWINVRLSNSVFSPQVTWQGTRDSVGYARKLRYRFFDRGGYVAMCKYYRNRLIAKGGFVTLRQKQQRHPQLAKLIGAIDLYMRGREADRVTMLKSLEAKGVRKILINSEASAENLAWMREQGYLTGSYQVYAGIYPPRPGLDEAHSRGYPQDAYMQKDGTPVRGFGYSEQMKSTYRCSVRQISLMRDLIPPLLRQKPYEALFLDVVTAGAPRECYSPDHPLNRTEDIQRHIEMLQYVSSLDVVVGSEDGNDWAAPYVEYLEGISMPRRFGYSTEIMSWPKPFELSEEYKNVDLDERVRVPLWDLVFHDSVVPAWRWEHTPDRYNEAKWWDKHDLLQLISGSMPIFMVDPSHLETYGDRIVQSYKTCAEWNAKTGWDELVDHRALTPDRSVQESRFSSGWSVIVNFSEKPYTNNSGNVIPPISYRIQR